MTIVVTVTDTAAPTRIVQQLGWIARKHDPDADVTVVDRSDDVGSR